MPRLIASTGSDPTRRCPCRWPIGLPQKATVCGYLSWSPICVTACEYIRRHRGWFMPTHQVDTCNYSRLFPLPVDFLRVGHRVGLWCILTVHLLSEILGTASIKVASWYIRKASNPLSGHHSPRYTCHKAPWFKQLVNRCWIGYWRYWNSVINF